MTKLTSNQRTNEVRKIIQDKIRYKRENTLLNHFRTIFDQDYDNYSGILKGNAFALWRYSRWDGIFYPIIYGILSEVNDVKSIRITTKMNPFGFLLSMCLIVGVFASTFFSGTNQDSILDYFSASIVISLMIVAMRLGYRHGRKIELAELEELLKEKATDSQID